jgi:hypothetical protein
MPNSEHPEALFSYSLSFGEREFLVWVIRASQKKFCDAPDRSSLNVSAPSLPQA